MWEGGRFLRPSSDHYQTGMIDVCVFMKDGKVGGALPPGMIDAAGMTRTPPSPVIWPCSRTDPRALHATIFCVVVVGMKVTPARRW